ncbi:MAG TPA: hypothetical protein VKV20_06105 [Ktedonobacteraceae bacterium]|jgi:spore germination protein YaaH|nr:hypothetical protein [Ktedonobacteraceae bacterium]
MFAKYFRRYRAFILIALPVIGMLLIGLVRVTDPQAQTLVYLNSPILSQQAQQDIPEVRLLHGQLASLGWIVGYDCQRSLQAYMKTAATNPDAALVGTGWLDPTDGQLINGQRNSCMPGSASMDNVVQLIHSKGGMAYLTITMDTADAGAWTSQQQSDYIARAARDNNLIEPIIREVERLNYDGVIMDLEGGDATYPKIQQLFTTYNQHVWALLKPLHKLYGIALIHKVSDHDDYYHLNAFENWSLLGHSADFMVIMAVDQSYFTPGPTVSVPWLQQLLAYELQTMPQMVPHTIWELPLYGASWRLSGGKWIYDGPDYDDAQAFVSQLDPSEIDAASSNLNDPSSAHVVYTDSSGVEHALWYPTAQNLYHIITSFQQILKRVPQFQRSYLQVAFWYRATWEPTALWPMLAKVLPDAA